ncbi:MAG: hypothetical protein ILO68_07860, partial [Clostridia bacterium]|nr:hypothetical protein [Clostridia bacterium]
MRDYKQMKEIQELKKQQASEEAEAPEAEAVPEEDKGENGKYSHRGPGFKGWLQYVWDYYKWPILIIGLIAVGVFVGIRQATANSNPDLSVTYVGPFYLSPDSQDDLRKEFADLCGEQNKNGDFNGDGEFRCAILDLTITYVKDADKNVYVYDEQNGAYTRFQTELRAGDTMLYFLDPRYYAEAKAEGVLQKLDTVIGDASLSFDGYGLYLGDLPCYSRPGFSRMPAGTVVCLRQTPAEDAIRYGRTEDSWKAHAELLKAMVKETDPAPEREPDAELLYVASEPAYRSVSEQIAKNAPDIPDANADGVSFLSVRSVCLNGRGGEARKASAEKAVRTEIVAGKT